MKLYPMKKIILIAFSAFLIVLDLNAQTLVAYYPFNNNGNDASGFSNHASSTGGGAYVPDRNNVPASAISLNGSQIITVPNSASLSLTTKYSISAYVSQSSFAPGFQSIVSKDVGAGMNNPKWIFCIINNNTLAYHINGPGYSNGYWVYSNVFTPVLNTVYQYAMIKNGTSVSFFINGVAAGGGTLPASSYDPNIPLYIGYSEAGGNLYGTIDEVRIYNDAINPTVLPINFISFTGTRAGNTTELKWEAASQQDVNRFEIERSTDGIHFSSAGAISKHFFSIYKYMDEILKTGSVWYRIAAVNNDGSKSYSDIIRIGGQNNAGIKISSLDISNGFRVLNYSAAGFMVIRLYNSIGQPVYQSADLPPAGSSKTFLPGLPAGIYVAQIYNSNGESIFIEKIILKNY